MVLKGIEAAFSVCFFPSMNRLATAMFGNRFYFHGGPAALRQKKIKHKTIDMAKNMNQITCWKILHLVSFGDDHLNRHLSPR